MQRRQFEGYKIAIDAKLCDLHGKMKDKEITKIDKCWCKQRDRDPKRKKVFNANSMKIAFLLAIAVSIPMEVVASNSKVKSLINGGILQLESIPSKVAKTSYIELYNFLSHKKLNILYPNKKNKDNILRSQRKSYNSWKENQEIESSHDLARVTHLNENIDDAYKDNFDRARENTSLLKKMIISKIGSGKPFLVVKNENNNVREMRETIHGVNETSLKMPAQAFHRRGKKSLYSEDVKESENTGLLTKFWSEISEPASFNYTSIFDNMHPSAAPSASELPTYKKNPPNNTSIFDNMHPSAAPSASELSTYKKKPKSKNMIFEKRNDCGSSCLSPVSYSLLPGSIEKNPSLIIGPMFSNGQSNSNPKHSNSTLLKHSNALIDSNNESLSTSFYTSAQLNLITSSKSKSSNLSNENLKIQPSEDAMIDKEHLNSTPSLSPTSLDSLNIASVSMHLIISNVTGQMDLSSEKKMQDFCSSFLNSYLTDHYSLLTLHVLNATIVSQEIYKSNDTNRTRKLIRSRILYDTEMISDLIIMVYGEGSDNHLALLAPLSMEALSDTKFMANLIRMDQYFTGTKITGLESKESAYSMLKDIGKQPRNRSFSIWQVTTILSCFIIFGLIGFIIYDKKSRQNTSFAIENKMKDIDFSRQSTNDRNENMNEEEINYTDCRCEDEDTQQQRSQSKLSHFIEDGEVFHSPHNIIDCIMTTSREQNNSVREQRIRNHPQNTSVRDGVNGQHQMRDEHKLKRSRGCSKENEQSFESRIRKPSRRHGKGTDGRDRRKDRHHGSNSRGRSNSRVRNHGSNSQDRSNSQIQYYGSNGRDRSNTRGRNKSSKRRRSPEQKNAPSDKCKKSISREKHKKIKSRDKRKKSRSRSKRQRSKRREQSKENTRGERMTENKRYPVEIILNENLEPFDKNKSRVKSTKDSIVLNNHFTTNSYCGKNGKERLMKKKSISASNNDKNSIMNSIIMAESYCK